MMNTELDAEKQDIETLKEVKRQKSLRGKVNETKEEQITAGGLQKKETRGGPFIPCQSDTVAGDSNSPMPPSQLIKNECITGEVLNDSRDITKITAERDELKEQCENLTKQQEEAVVVSNLGKKPTTIFQDRPSSPRESKELEWTGRRRLRIRRYH